MSVVAFYLSAASKEVLLLYGFLWLDSHQTVSEWVDSVNSIYYAMGVAFV